ncbi:L-lactate dehydrogenase (cytochrome) [Monosporozyma unispora]
MKKKMGFFNWPKNSNRLMMMISQAVKSVSKRQLQKRIPILTKQCQRALVYSTKSSHSSSSGKNRKVLGLSIAAATTTAGLLFLYQNETNPQILNDSGVKQSKKLITPNEVSKHNTPDDCWVVIDGKVYNLTEFINIHPGGPLILKLNAGMDVTAIFKPLHAKGTLEKYVKPEWYIGELTEPMPDEFIAPPYTPGETPEEIIYKENLRKHLPNLGNILNLYDFEKLASKILSNQAWAYYSSGSDDEISMRENHNAFHRIFFKPRILVDVSEVNLETEMLGEKVDLPFYITATALMKLGNPQEGEMGITKGCTMSPWKIPQMISTLASCSIDEIVKVKGNHPEQIQWYQLYVNSDRKITRDLVKHVENLGLKALFVTVDAPSLGHREKDLKIKFSNQNNGPQVMSDHESNSEGASQGATRAISKFIDPSLTWDDISKLHKLTHLPIIIKGVQRSEDVVKAAQVGCAGVVISNHGGRQLDFSRAPVEILAEAKPKLVAKGLDKKFDIFIDGGIRRSTDILKALCLGAKGVGLGRPFIYANSCYGEQGVAHAIKLLKEELEMDMRLLGATSIKDLGPEFLDMSALKNRNVSVAKDQLYDGVYRSPQAVEINEDDID